MCNNPVEIEKCEKLDNEIDKINLHLVDYHEIEYDPFSQEGTGFCR